MKKCAQCGYKNADDLVACNLCSSKLPDQPTRERGAPGDFSFEPRMMVGGARPKTIAERGAGASAGAPAPSPTDKERHYLVPPVGDPVALTPGTVALIGRDEGCQVRINQPKVSRKHAEIRWEGAPPAAILQDLGAANGSFVNDERLDKSGKRALKNGDTVTIGGVATKYRLLPPGVPDSSLQEGESTGASTVVAAADDLGGAGLLGNAAIMPIGEVLNRLKGLQASGILFVEAGGARGAFTIDKGDVVTGNYAGLTGQAAVTAVTSLTKGQFRFEQTEPKTASLGAPADATPKAASGVRPATGAVPPKGASGVRPAAAAPPKPGSAIRPAAGAPAASPKKPGPPAK